MDAAAAERAPGRRLPTGRVLGPRRPPLVLLGLGLAVGLAAALPALYLVVAVLDDAGAALDAVLTDRT
ncbi:MAG: iron ABC transporter permease, partial [Solirubrobacteraceae bacterium]